MCIHACICAHGYDIYVQMCMTVPTYTDVNICACVYMGVYDIHVCRSWAWVCLCTWMCMCACTCVQVFCMCVPMYIDVDVFTCVHRCGGQEKSDLTSSKITDCNRNEGLEVAGLAQVARLLQAPVGSAGGVWDSLTSGRGEGRDVEKELAAPCLGEEG